ncbi:MAG: hypothetical protein ACTSYD_05210 [Candidatus Heimdallarchaeaceae archaeon]
MIIVQYERGGRGAVVSAIVQRESSSDIRATLSSLYSSIGSLLYFPVSALFVILNLSMGTVLLSMLILSIILTLGFAYLVYLKRNGKDANKIDDKL